MGVIVFNGVSSADYGIVVEHFPDTSMPQRDYGKTHVTGRNGDIVTYAYSSYGNVERNYDVAVADKKYRFWELADRISDFCHAGTGYCRLEDSYDPEHYRMAMFNESGDIMNILDHGARATLTFDCKPERYLKIGEKTISYDVRDNEAIEYRFYNPTPYPAKPIIRLYSTGGGNAILKWTANNLQSDFDITLRDIANDWVEIDCEKETMYQWLYGEKQWLNTRTTATTFPLFGKGENTFRFEKDGTEQLGISKMEVIPRWWRL